MILTLPTGAVDVWWASLKREPALIQALHGLLSKDEIDCTARFRRDADRNRYIVAHGHLRILLGAYLNCAPQSIQFQLNAFGKPSITDAQGLYFNISHSHDLALYAFARNTEVGVDVEYMRANTAVEDVAEHYFSATENAALRSFPDDEKYAAFFACWTRKEAYIKAKGEGLSIPLDSFDVSMSPKDPPQVLRIGDDPHEAARWSLFELRPMPGYAGALVIEGRNWTLNLQGSLDLLVSQVLVKETGKPFLVLR